MDLFILILIISVLAQYICILNLDVMECCHRVMCEQFHVFHNINGDYLTTNLKQWFPKCASRFPMDPQLIPTGSVDTFL
jgi:hypothetical protein